ncbi:hypothetical protein [Leptospira yanagawae]|nr:hypothetical protein [Leptospira yanagawae]
MKFKTLVVTSIFLILFTCKPSKLSNACDPNSDSYLITTILRFLTNDTSPSCWLGFTKDLDLWGIHGGAVLAAYFDEKRILLGGTFSYVGPNVGNVAVLNPNTGILIDRKECPYPEVNGSSNAVTGDGEGGFFVSGSFTSVQGISASGVAHIKKDCTVDPNFSGAVSTINGQSIYAMVHYQDKLYVTGNFANLNGIPRLGLARLDARTGAIDSTWIANLQGLSQVGYVLKMDGDYLYVGGNFSTIAGTGYQSLARFNLVNGTLDTSWIPTTAANENIRDLAFGTTNLGTEVVFSVGDATPTSFYVNPLAGPGAALGGYTVNFTNGGAATAIQYRNGQILIAGNFSEVNGVTTGNFAILNNTNAGLVSGSPHLNTNNEIFRLYLHEDSLILFGKFTSILGKERNYGAAINLNSYELTNFDPNFSFEPNQNFLNSTIIGGNRLVVPGVFTSVNGVKRTNLVELSRDTGKPTEWNPYLDQSVYRIRSSDSKFYIGGVFQTYNNIPNTVAFVSLNKNDLSLTEERFGISATHEVTEIHVGKDKVFVSGTFTSAQSLARFNFAAFDKNTGVIDSGWDATAVGGQAATMLEIGDFLFAGGYFTQLGGNPVSFLHRISVSNGQSSGIFFTNAPDDYIQAISLWNDNLCIGGAFLNIGGNPYTNFSCYDLSSNTVSTPDFNFAASSVKEIQISPSGKAILSGTFSQIGGINRTNYAVFDLVSQTLTSYNPIRNGNISGTYLTDKEIIHFGGFTSFDNRIHGGFRILPISAVEN